MSNLNAWKWSAFFLLLSLLMGCESKEDRILQTLSQQSKLTAFEIDELGNALDRGHIRNAKLLKEYAQTIKSYKPELGEIADLIALDATKQGPLYLSLQTRLKQLSNSSDKIKRHQEIMYQLSLLRESAKISLFSDALTDPINVLADMSEGKLARIGAISKKAETAMAKGQDFGPGSQLIGNPNYGTWQTDSSGTSFWQWYGMYRMLGDLVDDIEYGRWSKHRRYSYYSDFGHTRYSSPKQKSHFKSVEKKTRQNYARQGKQFSSPYAKKRAGSASLSRSSHTPAKTKTSFVKSSSYGTVRGSTSRTSRGVSRGK